jgi:hypothetical protein
MPQDDKALVRERDEIIRDLLAQLSNQQTVIEALTRALNDMLRRKR